MASTNTCFFCGNGGRLLFSSEQKCHVHSQCIVEKLTHGDRIALAIAKEFDMVSNASECTVGCDECKDRWCGR